jgi:hypothetical protein
MRRVLAVGLSVNAVALALLLPAGAQAAAPVLGTLSATDIQGVSAVVVGSVDPEGLSGSYYFEYTTQSTFAGAAHTQSYPSGDGTATRPARAAISGLSPSTTYRFRLVATNASGTSVGAPESFSTTQGFGLLPGEEGFAARVAASGGEAATAAGSHPYELDISVGLREGGSFEGQSGVALPDGDLRDLEVSLPPGFLANPAALPACDLSAFSTPRSSPFEESASGESCPADTQVGTAEVVSSSGGGRPRRFGLFNLVPPPGVAAQIGFSPYGSPLAFSTDLDRRPDGSYVIDLDAAGVSQALDLTSLSLSFWGTPWATSHDGERGNCLNEREPAFSWAKCSAGDPRSAPPEAYLTLPARCSGGLSFGLRATSWQQPSIVTATAVSRDSEGAPAELGHCQVAGFTPQATAQLTTTRTSSASGLNFTLNEDQRQLTEPQLAASPPTQRLVVSLPPGVTLNPSLAAGLGSCTEAQLAAERAGGAQGEGCPNGSKIGDFEAQVPLFEGAAEGAVYLATPGQNPFGSLLALYLVARIPTRGVLVEAAGDVALDPVSGNLTATFEGLPQLPYTGLSLTLRSGNRAPLITPSTCQSAIARVDLAAWGGGAPEVHAQSASQIVAGSAGGPCPSGPPPFSPGVFAGGVNSNVNSYTPYFVHLTRTDSEQEITGYSLILPRGITGKLAGIPVCSDAAIEAARHTSGVEENRSPSCPAASEVGHILTGYGVGDTLAYTEGEIYLAGPYNGQPLSLVVINPATVGPFDLGTVVIRSAFVVDEHTAQLRIDRSASDAIPHILDGVPLHLRDIRIYMDRPEFTHNPSSCEPSQLESTLGGSGTDFSTSADDTTATVAEHFQLLNCLTLGFRPKLGIRLRGATRRGAFPALRATFAARGPGDTNLKDITVSLPHSEFLAQSHIRGICTRPAFEAGHCPANSVYGTAVAYTPLLEQPLRGDVYLRSSSHRLPDLVADLYSRQIRIVLEGKVGPTKGGGIAVSFSELPDEPLDRFVMNLSGGKQGLLTNSTDICANPPEATVKALGQSNLGASFTTKLRGHCGKGKGKKHRSPATRGHGGKR